MQSGFHGAAGARGADYYWRADGPHGAGAVGDRSAGEPDGDSPHDLHVAGDQTTGERAVAGRSYRSRITCAIASSAVCVIERATVFTPSTSAKCAARPWKRSVGLPE